MSEKPVESYGLDAHCTMIVEQFRENREVFEKMLKVVKDLLKKSIEDNHIYINAIEGRCNHEESLLGNLSR